ncbi:MAG: hypothetical protein IKF36_03960 [Bacilli bacterium]|nr:hypothetical protein [Bacilli bacterium]
MREKKNILLNKKFLIPVFLLLLVGVSLGYSALQTTLQINGNTKISKTEWIVHFSNIQVTEGSYLNSGNNTAVIDANDDTKVTYTVTLNAPGDFYEFTVDIVNEGTLPAKLDAIRETGLTPAQIAEIPYLDYSVTGMPSVGDVLNVGAANKNTVTIRVEYPLDITAQELPGSDYTFTKTIELDYVQNRS